MRRLLLPVCRCVVLFALVIVLAIGALFWSAPDLDQYRPELEATLRSELNLSTLELGPLSWRWSWRPEVRADKLAFTTADQSLRLHDGTLIVHLSLLKMVAGEASPTLILLDHPLVEFDGDKLATATKRAQQQLPKLHLKIRKGELHWRDGQMHDQLHELDADLRSDKQQAIIKCREFSATLRWDQAEQLQALTFNLPNSLFLPEPVRGLWRGPMMLSLQGERQAGGIWQVKSRITALTAHGTALVDKRGRELLRFATLDTTIQPSWPADSYGKSGLAALLPSAINIPSAELKDGPYWLKASARWDGQFLKAELTPGGIFPLERIWPWLRDIGEEEWQRWLFSMHKGAGHELRGRLLLPWSDLLIAPTAAQWLKAKFRVEAEVRDADIALNPSGELLTAVSGHLLVDDTHLVADASNAQLPGKAGTIAGQFSIEWLHLLMRIGGKANVDVGGLLEWIGQGKEVADIHWNSAAPAQGEFALTWQAEQGEPYSGTARLHPVGTWNLIVNNERLDLSGGEILWQHHKSVSLNGLKLEAGLFTGSGSLQLAPTINHAKTGEWEIASLQASGQSDLYGLTQRFILPVEKPQGPVQFDLSWKRGEWSGLFDLSEARWSKLFGSRKTDNAPWRIRLSGSKESAIRLSASDPLLRINGEVQSNSAGIRLNLSEIQSGGYSGSLRFFEPADKGAMTIDLNARYITRDFLPDNLPSQAGGISRPWRLNASIGDVRWASASAKGAVIQATSDARGIGSFRADSLSVANIHLDKPEAEFRLISSKEIDILQMSALLYGQSLSLSATLHSQADNAIRWRGFAMFNGEFAPVIEKIQSKPVFADGQFAALLSVSGLLTEADPWWQNNSSRLRLRVDDGRFLEGGPFTKLLALASLADLPKLLIARRSDLIGKGMLYEHLLLEAAVTNRNVHIEQLALRATAMDVAGFGDYDLSNRNVDLKIVLRPLQNLDAMLGEVPLLRDLLGGVSRSLLRKVYRIRGPLADAKVETISPQQAGLAAPGLIEALLTLPTLWFE